MSAPIEPRYSADMNELARFLDRYFNGSLRGHDRKVGFVLLVSEFGRIEDGRVNYISNGERADTIAMLKEFIARAEGRYAEGGAA